MLYLKINLLLHSLILNYGNHLKPYEMKLFDI